MCRMTLRSGTAGSMCILIGVKIAFQRDDTTFTLSPRMYAGEFSHILTNNLLPNIGLLRNGGIGPGRVAQLVRTSS